MFIMLKQNVHLYMILTLICSRYIWKDFLWHFGNWHFLMIYRETFATIKVFRSKLRCELLWNIKNGFISIEGYKLCNIESIIKCHSSSNERLHYSNIREQKSLIEIAIPTAIHFLNIFPPIFISFSLDFHVGPRTLLGLKRSCSGNWKFLQFCACYCRFLSVQFDQTESTDYYSARAFSCNSVID